MKRKMHKADLIAWVKSLGKPKLQPQLKEISMPDKKALFAIIKNLMDAYINAKMRIDTLESANLSLMETVKDLEDARAADAAQDAEMASAIQDILTPVDAGGSVGGNTEIN